MIGILVVIYERLAEAVLNDHALKPRITEKLYGG